MHSQTHKYNLINPYITCMYAFGADHLVLDNQSVDVFFLGEDCFSLNFPKANFLKLILK